MSEEKTVQAVAPDRDKINQTLTITSVQDKDFNFDAKNSNGTGEFSIEGYFDTSVYIGDNQLIQGFLRENKINLDKENKFKATFKSKNALSDFVKVYNALLQAQSDKLLINVGLLEERISSEEIRAKDLEKKAKAPKEAANNLQNQAAIEAHDVRLKGLKNEKLKNEACIQCIQQSRKILKYLDKKLKNSGGDKIPKGLKFQGAFTMLAALSQEDETPLQRYHVRVAKLKKSSKKTGVQTFTANFKDKNEAAGDALRDGELATLDGETARLFHSDALTRHENKAKVKATHQAAYAYKARIQTGLTGVTSKKKLSKFNRVNIKGSSPIVVGVMPLFTKRSLLMPGSKEGVPRDLARIGEQTGGVALGAVYICMDGKSEARQLMQGHNGMDNTAVYSCPAAWAEVSQNDESWQRATYGVVNHASPEFTPEERAQYSTLVDQFNLLAKGWQGAKAHLFNNRFVCFELPTQDFNSPPVESIQAYAVAIEIGRRLAERNCGIFSHCKSGEGRGPLPAVMLKLITTPASREAFLKAASPDEKKAIILKVFLSVKEERSQVSLSEKASKKDVKERKLNFLCGVLDAWAENYGRSLSKQEEKTVGPAPLNVQTGVSSQSSVGQPTASTTLSASAAPCLHSPSSSGASFFPVPASALSTPPPVSVHLAGPNQGEVVALHLPKSKNSDNEDPDEGYRNS